MGFLGNLMGGRSYEPGGEHYVKITDISFERACGELSNSDSPYAGPFKDFAAAQAKHFELEKYEAHDFPVAHIVAVFCLAHYLQEENNGIPESLRVGYIEAGRKDMQDYLRWFEKWREKLPGNEKGFVKGALSKGTDLAIEKGGGLALGVAVFAAKGITKGVARIVTGKSGDVRIFEKLYGNYICGDSQKAREYIMGFAEKIGVLDDGVISVSESIMAIFWLSEIARANRSKQ